MPECQCAESDGCFAFSDEGCDVGGEDSTATPGTDRAKSIFAPMTGKANLKLITDPAADEHPDIRAAIDEAVQTTMTAHGTVSFIDCFPFPDMTGMPKPGFSVGYGRYLPLVRRDPFIRQLAIRRIVTSIARMFLQIK